MALAIVQQPCAKRDPAGAGIACPLAATSAGNLLVAVIHMRTGGSQSVTNVTDSAGQTWTHTSDGVNTATGFHTGSNGRVEIWHFANTVAGVTSVTPTLSTNLIHAITVFEVSGALTASPVDKVGNGDNNATPNPTAGSITTTNAANILIGEISFTQAGGTVTSPGAPWVDFTTNPETGTGAANQRAAGVTQIVAATGTYAPVWTTSGANSGGGSIASFKAAPDVVVVQGSPAAGEPFAHPFPALVKKPPTREELRRRKKRRRNIEDEQLLERMGVL